MQEATDPEDGDVVHVRPDDLDRWETELELVADIWAADARAARHAAERAAAVGRLARRRRKALDRVFGPRGGPGVDSRQLAHPALADSSELLIPEVALIRHCSGREAEVLVVESLALTTTLTGTWSALYEGRIDEKKMKALVDLLGSVAAGIAHADGGPTDCWNLCCLCRRHHRIKTFADGWSFTLLPDGRLVVRTPSGVSRLTWPPGWWWGAEPDPPELEEEAPPDLSRT